MPRKSSKTAHVLNLLTSTKEEAAEPSKKAAEQDTAEVDATVFVSESVEESVAEVSALPNDDDISKQIEKVIPEIIEEHVPIAEPIQEMKETVSEILSGPKEEHEMPEMQTIVPTMEQKNDYDIPMPVHTDAVGSDKTDEAAPFSYTPSVQTVTPEIIPSPLPKSAVASMLIAQKKAEEKMTEIPEPVQEIASESPVYEEKDMTLVNLTEKSAAKRIPDIMKKFNMCTCERCYYDVLALTLNSVPQKTVIVPKDDIERKINEYELDATIDMVTAISKSCVHVKISPRH